MTEDAKKPDDLVCPEGFFKGVKYFLIGNIEEKVRKLGIKISTLNMITL